MKKLLLTALAMLIVIPLSSAEIIPIWDRTATNGEIFDIEFMPGGEQFMLSSSTGEIQIRNSEDGELDRTHIDTTNLFMNGYFEFTPDSNRIVIARSGLLQLVNISDFKRLNYFAFGKDTVIKGFHDLVLDPIRPYAYVTLNGHSRETGFNDKRCKIQVYNYETMELVKDLTPYGEDDYTAIEVSHEGKYLATLNDNKAYLKVWDLETMELIVNEPLFDVNNDDWCRAKDIYFSKIEENVIYISGNFTQKISSNDLGSGAYKYYMKNKTRELILPNEIYGSDKLIFIDNESRIINTNTGIIGVINLKENQLEYYKLPPENVFTTLVRYSNAGDYFIGASYNNRISKFIYDSQSNVENNYDDEIRISPNPTNGFVKINSNCSEPLINYNISDTNGILLIQSTMENNSNNLQFDFSPYPSGVYFLTINCNNQLETYKIIKEG